MNTPTAHAAILAQLTDITSRIDPHDSPFLHYLPRIIRDPQVKGLTPEHALRFVTAALQPGRPQIVTDAVGILNRVVDPSTGELIPLYRTKFRENHSFLWSELGDRTDPGDAIIHVFNKTIFMMSVGT